LISERQTSFFAELFLSLKFKKVRLTLSAQSVERRRFSRELDLPVLILADCG
jgi:hypothetical protein